MFVRRRIERAADDSFRVRLPRGERAILRAVRAELESLLDDDPGDTALRRLFPPAYADAEDEAEYRRLVGDELVDGRRRALEVARETVDSDRWTAAEAQAWLSVLNDARLVLGTRLDVSEDVLLSRVDPRAPRARERAVYVYLSWLQEQLVDAIAAGVDPSGRS